MNKHIKQLIGLIEIDGIVTYCVQICGGDECGNGRICKHGIDPKTELPATFDLTQDEAAMLEEFYA